MSGQPGGPAGGIEQLYPFLYGGAPGGAPDSAAELIRSTEVKIRDIDRLRAECLQLYGELLADCARSIADRITTGGRIFTFGNGGSSTDALALATLFLHPPAGRPIPAFSLAGEVAVVTALANDVSFDIVFARQLATLGQPRDVALALSTSGNSTNVMRALDTARQKGMLRIGFAGNDGGQMASEADLDYLFVVPSASVHRIQEAQTSIYQVLWELTQQAVEGVALRP